MRKRMMFLGLMVVMLLFSSAPVASRGMGAPGGGFQTTTPAMLTASAAGASVQPIISVGDTLGNGYRFEAIPDGIGIVPNGSGTVDVFVTHETSLVPFPYTVAGSTATGFSDFDNAQISRLKLQQSDARVLS